MLECFVTICFILCSLLRSQWGDVCLHIGPSISWPLLAMPMLGVSLLVVFLPCRECPLQPTHPSQWENHRQSLWAGGDFGEYSGQSPSGLAIILKVFLTWALYIPLMTVSLCSPEITPSLTVWICMAESLTLIEICFRKHMVTQPVEWQTRDQIIFPDSQPNAFLPHCDVLSPRTDPTVRKKRIYWDNLYLMRAGKIAEIGYMTRRGNKYLRKECSSLAAKK